MHAVVAHRIARQRHGSVLRPAIGIEKYLGLGIERSGGVQHALRLQSVVLAPEIAAALAERQAITLVVEKSGLTRLDFVTRRNRGQIVESDLVLRLDPCLCIGSVVILKPAVRVGNLYPVIGIDNVNLLGFGIGQRQAEVASAAAAKTAIA